jgi:hypothetical protein
MSCFKLTLHTLRLSVGGRTDGRTDGRTENIYSIFRDKLLLLGEHGFGMSPQDYEHPLSHQEIEVEFLR